MKVSSTFMAVFLILTFFSHSVVAEEDVLNLYSMVLVVSSSQDGDIAKLVAESRDYNYYETQWGKFSQHDAESVSSIEPDLLLIIGGPHAVPEKVEEVGIKSIRVGGQDRIETASMALKKFFDFDAKKSYILPSESEVKELLFNSREKTAYLYLGDSKVSERWGLYYKEKLRPFFKAVCLAEPSKYQVPENPKESCDAVPISKNKVYIGVGNVKNNHFVNENWYLTRFPEQVSAFPLIFLSNLEEGSEGHESNILLITGTDQNIFYTQRSMEDMHIVKHDLKGISIVGIFTVLLMLLVGILRRKKMLDSSYFIFLVFSFPVLVIFYFRNILINSQIYWDSLYVYFDGALSLFFFGEFDTILDVRNPPGTSLVTYLFFKITNPTDMNAYYLQGFLFCLMILSVSLISYRLYGKTAGVLAFVLMISNPYLFDRLQLFASDVPFTSFLVTLLLLMFFFINRSDSAPAKSKDYLYLGMPGILFCFLILMRHSGALIFLAFLMNVHRLKEKKGFVFVPFISGLIVAFGVHYTLTGNLASPISTYFDEMIVRTDYDLSYAASNFITSIKNSAVLINYILAFLVVYRFYITLASDNPKNSRIKFYESILITFSALHIFAMSLWPVAEWRYAIPVIPVLTIYGSGATSKSFVGERHAKVMTALVIMAIILNLFFISEEIRLV